MKKTIISVTMAVILVSFSLMGLTVSAVPATDNLVIAVNCGGPATGDFLADQAKSASNTWGYQGTAQQAFSTGVTEGNEDFGIPDVFKSEMCSQSSDFQYIFVLPNKKYRVEMYIAETWFTASGNRIGDYTLEGQAVQANYDVLKIAKPKEGAMISAEVTLTDGVLNVGIVPKVSAPNINAIRIYEVSEATTAPTEEATTQPAETTAAPTEEATTQPAEETTAAPTEEVTTKPTDDGKPNSPATGDISIIASMVLAGASGLTAFKLKKK